MLVRHSTQISPSVRLLKLSKLLSMVLPLMELSWKLPFKMNSALLLGLINLKQFVTSPKILVSTESKPVAVVLVASNGQVIDHKTQSELVLSAVLRQSSQRKNTWSNLIVHQKLPYPHPKLLKKPLVPLLDHKYISHFRTASAPN